LFRKTKQGYSLMGFYDFSLYISHVGDKIPVASENDSSSRPLTRSAKGNHAP
jgi:hypothetical protein